MLTIDLLNKKNQVEFISILGEIFEHSPWIAEKAAEEKPFSSLHHLYQAMVTIVESSSMEQKLALIKAHPNLGDRVAMSADSIQEQKGAGLSDLTPFEYDNFITLNKRYMDKFRFPFIMAVRGKNKYEIYEAMQARIHNQKDLEFQTALAEIYEIARLRLEEKFS